MSSNLTYVCVFVVCGTSVSIAKDVVETSTGNTFEHLPKILDIRYKDACGPIACLSAFHCLGIDSSLDTTAAGCHWSEGQTIPFKSIVSFVNSDSRLRTRLARMSPQTLKSILSKPRVVALLPVRKNSDEVNHVICVALSKAGQLCCFDYPKVYSEFAPDSLKQIWDGEVLLIERKLELLQSVDWCLIATAVLLLTFFVISTPAPKTPKFRGA